MASPTTATVPRPAPRQAPTPSQAPARTPPPQATAPAAPTSSPPAARPTPTTTAAPPRAIAKPGAKPSKLGDVTSGVLDQAWRFFIFGTRGGGKSTLAADAPDVIFLDIDQGSGHLPVKRYPLGTAPTYQDILDAIEDLTVNPHPFPIKAVVIDEAAGLEALVHQHVVEQSPVDKHGDKPTNIEEVGGGYQKGYVVAEQEWRRFVSLLDTLRARRGVHVIILSHASIANTKNPTGENFDRHVPQIHPKAAAVLCGKADVVGFLTFDDVAKRVGRKTIGFTGRRVVHFEHSAAVSDAKTRLPLPPLIDLPEDSPWSPFADAIEALRSMTPTSLRAAIDGELARLGENFVRENGAPGAAAGVRTAVARAGDNVADLHRYLTALQQSTPSATADAGGEEGPKS